MALPEGILLSEAICLQWQQRQGAGAGLYNMGETCFINSVLQCLTYTPPLANYFFSGLHRHSCKQQDFCMMCAMEVHVCDVLQSAGCVLQPMSVISSLRWTGQHFLYGRQEDAHEFLCFMLLAMQRVRPTGSSSLRVCLQSRNIIQQIFEGLLRSRLTCLSCKAVSDSYEAFLDVPLDIKGPSSVRAALQGFVQPEQLDGANCIRCRRCDTVAAASKAFTIQEAPAVLTLSLKRFSMTGRKLGKAVQFPLNLDLRPYMSQAEGEPCPYSLYAVLVHRGDSCASGHYFCYIKASNGLWYQMDDDSVMPCSIGTMLQQQAYLLFYIRCSAPDTVESTSPSPAPPQACPLLSACEAGSGQLDSPHCQRSNGASKRPCSRSCQKGNDPCGSTSTDTTGCSPSSGRKRRTDPPNPDGASSKARRPRPFMDSPKQAPVPTAAVEQPQLGTGCSPAKGRKRRADPPNRESAPRAITPPGRSKSLLPPAFCKQRSEWGKKKKAPNSLLPGLAQPRRGGSCFSRKGK